MARECIAQRPEYCPATPLPFCFLGVCERHYDLFYCFRGCALRKRNYGLREAF